MTIKMHDCVTRGPRTLGDQLDCLPCWKALEQSVELAQSEGTFTGDNPPDDPSGKPPADEDEGGHA